MDELFVAVCRYLAQIIPSEKVFSEQIPQNAPQTFIFVDQITAGRTNRIDGQSLRTETLDIRYHGGTNMACRKMQEQLMGVFDLVPFQEGYTRGYNIESNITDRVLHVMVDFDVAYDRIKIPSDRMQTMSEKTGVKYGGI